MSSKQKTHIAKNFRVFYTALFLTTLLPFIPNILPFLPSQLFGFNWTGWAWITMLIVTIVYLPIVNRLTFPILFWLPWILFLIGYIILDYSFIGLQLTLQYILPIIIGVVVSGFSYNEENIAWIYKLFKRITIIVLMIAIFYRLVFGFSPAMAAIPMLFSIGASFAMAFYFVKHKFKFLAIFFLLFALPIVNITRMGIAAFLVIFIFHFANRNLVSKIGYAALGIVMLILVFNTPGFQEKTFYSGSGKLSDLSFNYYENDVVNSSGRSSWINVLDYGLQQAPVWGNGPRSDNFALTEVTGRSAGEAHNDYLSVRYNYGFVGLGLLLFGFITSFAWIFFKHRKAKHWMEWIIATSTLTLFLSFMMFMYSDNILKYTIYFPNYFFALIGMYAAIRKRGIQSTHMPVVKHV